VRKRLYVMEGPDGKPIGFFPTDIVMVVPINLPGEPTGLKDEKGNEVPAKTVYRKDLSGLISANVQQPIYVKGEIPAVCNELNQRLKWAEEFAEWRDAKPDELLSFEKDGGYPREGEFPPAAYDEEGDDGR
jgi:hypothetical protein